MVLKISAVLLGVTIVVLVIAWLELRGPDIPYETLEAKYTESASHFVDLPGGLHVHYRDEGDPNRPLLVLLHGQNDLLIEPANAHKFAAEIPGANLVLCPQVGHLPQVEIPARSAADVAEFLQTPQPR